MSSEEAQGEAESPREDPATGRPYLETLVAFLSDQLTEGTLVEDLDLGMLNTELANELLVKVGDALFETNLPRALDAYIRADHSPGMIDVGNAFFEKEEGDSALEAYRSALSLDGINNVGKLFLRQGCLDSAADVFKGTNNNNGLAEVAGAYLDKGELAKAEECCIITDDNDGVDTIADAYFEKQDYVAAERLYRLTSNPRGILSVGIAYLEADDSELCGALSCFELVYKHERNVDDGMGAGSRINEVGDCFFREKAFTRARHAYRIVGNTERLHFVRDEHLTEGDLDEAVFDEVTAGKQETPELFIELAGRALELKQPQIAAQAYTRAGREDLAEFVEQFTSKEPAQV